MSPLRLVVCGSVEASVVSATASAIERLSSGERPLVVHVADDGDAPSGAPEVAIVVVDPGVGALPHVLRPPALPLLLAARTVVLLVRGLGADVDAQASFDAVVAGFVGLARAIGLADVTAIPLGAAIGLTSDEALPPWYRGPTLRDVLASASPAPSSTALRVLVRRVDGDGLRGTVASGVLATGDRVRIQPSGRQSAVVRLVVDGDTRERVHVGDDVTVLLADPTAVAAGEFLSRADSPAEVADQFEATLVWTADDPLFPHRRVRLELAGQSVDATVSRFKYQVKPHTRERLAARILRRDEVGVCNLALAQPILFDPYTADPDHGPRPTSVFTLVDRDTGRPVGAGTLHFALRRAHNIQVQAVDVNKASRAALKGQKPCVLWFTGLSGAGKSTIANLVEKQLFAQGRHTYLLDGDNVRHGLNKNLGFTEGDRVENIRRAAEVAKLMVDAGLIVLTAFISPFAADRAMARSLFAAGEFVEIHVDTPLAVAEQRDVKGLYRKARRGELRNFTGIDSPYEVPQAPELSLDTVGRTPEDAAAVVVDTMVRLGLVEPAP